MTAFGGAYKAESQEARALRSINQESYDYRDQAKLLSKLTGDVSYMAQYMRNMQKGIDDANQNFIEQLTSMVNDLFVVVGGSGNTGFDFGDLKYIFQAIGALFGFDDATGIAKIFPINLFSAAWHFFSTYIVPINNFPEVINIIIDNAIATILDVLGEIPIIGGAVQQLAQWISNFRLGIANATEILGGIFSNWNEALTTGLQKIFANLKKIILFFTGNASDDLDELENWGKRLPIKDALGKILDVDIPDLDAKKITRGTLLRARLGVQDFENLAAGSDFETSDQPWTLAASHTIDTTTNKFGTKSLKLTATGTNATSTLEGEFPTEEDEQFLVAAWVKRDVAWNAAANGNTRLVISGMPGDAPIGGIYLGASNIGTAGLWHLEKSTVTVPVGTNITSLKIEIKTDTTATAGNAWLDNIIIRRVKGNDLIRDDLDAGKITKGRLLKRIIGVRDFENIAAGSDFEGVDHPWALAAAHTVDANTAKFGIQSLKCAANASPQVSTLEGDCEVTEGDRYYTELYAKRDSNWNGTSSNSRFVIRGLPGNVVLDSIPMGSTNFLGTIWDKKFMRTLIPSGYTSITFTIETGATTGNLWIDNIIVRRLKQGNDIDDEAITGDKTKDLDGSKITIGKILEDRLDDLSANKIVRGTLLRQRIGIKDFENLAAGSDFEGEHPWTLAANHVVDPTVNKFGSKSLKLIGSGANTSILQGEFGTTEGDQYLITYWAKKDAAWSSPSASSQFRVYGLVNGTPTLIKAMNLGSNDLSQLWTLKQDKFTIADASNITGLEFQIYTSNSSGNAWLDNIVIRRIYSEDQIADGAISDLKIRANAITASKIKNLEITAEKLANATIDGTKIGPLAIAASHIIDNAITSGKIGPLAVIAGKIAANAVDEPNIIDNAITNAKIRANAVTAAKLADLSVTSGKIADAAITGTKLGPLAVAASHIVDNAVTSGKIGPLAVTAGNIVDNAITNAKIVDNAITNAKIAANAITAAKINNLEITADKLADAAVTGAKLGPLAVAAGNIIDGAITSGKIGPLAVIAGKIADAAVTDTKLAAGAVTEAKLAALSVTAGKLADAAVTGTKLGPLAVAASHIVDNAVTSGKIGPLAVIAGKIASNAVTNSTIESGAVTNPKIASSAVSTSNLQNLAVTGEKTAGLDASKITGGTINASLLPSTLSVGSGIIMRRTTTATFSVAKGQFRFPTNFYGSVPSNTSDLTISSDGNGNLVVAAQYAGWYMVEVGFGVNQVTRLYTYNLSPLVFLNGVATKMGTTIDYYGSSAYPTNTQGSFILYLSAGHYVSPGVNVVSGGVWSTADLIKSNNTLDTYFSVSLLNRSLA